MSINLNFVRVGLLKKVAFGFVLCVVGLFFSLLVAEKANAAVFRLEPEIISSEANEEFVVDVYMDTQGEETDGADLVLRYNPDSMEAIEIIPGITYSNYPIQFIEEGKVSVTGIAGSTGPFFSGEDLFATIRFKALFGGEETLAIDFTQDSTTESNIALHAKGRDILSDIEESVLFISGQPPAEKPLINFGQAGRVLLLVFYVLIIIVVGFLVYRWWASKFGKDQDVFVPEQVPMDRPPG